MHFKAIIIILILLVSATGAGYYAFFGNQPATHLNGQPTKEVSREDKFFRTDPDKMAVTQRSAQLSPNNR